MDALFVKTVIGWLVLLLQILIMFSLFSLFIPSIRKSRAFALLKKNALLISFLIALTSMLGSLFFSEILGWEPCVLCWYQRIVLYPLVFIFGTALLRKKTDSFTYAIPLAIVGLFIAAYHFIIQLLAKFGTEVACSTNGVPCNVSPTWMFGYVTIPLMAFTAFTAILLFAWMHGTKE